MPVYISEHPLPRQRSGNLLATIELPALASQRLTNGAVSAQSATFAAGTRMIGVSTDAIISIAVGVNPTATPNDKRMAANTTEYFFVAPNSRIAVINNV